MGGGGGVTDTKRSEYRHKGRSKQTAREVADTKGGHPDTQGGQHTQREVNTQTHREVNTQT